jgi:hypothetical protein
VFTIYQGIWNNRLFKIYCSSCVFPNPSQQPKFIQESGLFNDKAITYVKEYFEDVIENILKQVVSQTKQRNVFHKFPNLI